MRFYCLQDAPYNCHHGRTSSANYYVIYKSRLWISDTVPEFLILSTSSRLVMLPSFVECSRIISSTSSSSSSRWNKICHYLHILLRLLDYITLPSDFQPHLFCNPCSYSLFAKLWGCKSSDIWLVIISGYSWNCSYSSLKLYDFNWPFDFYWQLFHRFNMNVCVSLGCVGKLGGPVVLLARLWLL